MPSGERAKQQHRAAAGSAGRTPPPVRLALSSSGKGHRTTARVEPLAKLGKLLAPPALGPPGPEGPPLENGPDLTSAGSPLPAGVGIADPQLQSTPHGPFVGSRACFSWLQTHAADGIIHIESPVQRTFTLANFFDVWGRLGDPGAIPLAAHAQIQLEVGRPLVGPVRISSWYGL